MVLLSCSEAQPIEDNHEQQDSLGAIVTRHKRGMSLPGHMFVTNICKEKTVEIDLQKHFKTTDVFNPPTILEVRCLSSKNVKGISYERCGPLAICKTKLRTVHFTRQPKGSDCRHMTQRQMRIGVSCECRKLNVG